jgi:uncharacterized protein YyaL (SSP411 family)
LSPEYLEFAISLAESMVARFFDREEGGFWQSPANANDLILRLKADYDGAEPSGNSVAVLVLLRLGRISERTEFKEAGEKTLRAFAARLREAPQGVPCLLQALDFALDEPHRAVVTGGAGTPLARELLHAVHSVYRPNRIIFGQAGPVEPFAGSLPADGAVYICTGSECLPPARTPEAVRERCAAGQPPLGTPTNHRM